MKRVAERVIQGGHNVPEEIIRRRYYAGLRNLVKFYLPLADSALLLDNSLGEMQRIIAEKNLGCSLLIEDMDVWQEIQRVAGD